MGSLNRSAIINATVPPFNYSTIFVVGATVNPFIWEDGNSSSGAYFGGLLAELRYYNITFYTNFIDDILFTEFSSMFGLPQCGAIRCNITTQTCNNFTNCSCNFGNIQFQIHEFPLMILFYFPSLLLLQ